VPGCPSDVGSMKSITVISTALLYIALFGPWRPRFYKFLRTVSLAEVDPLAVCSNGSPGIYYWSKATTEPNMWLVYLMGGGWCYDQKSCDARCKGFLNKWSRLCGTWLYPPYYPADGIFQPRGNDFLKGANQVFVPYCTSDAHMGNASAMGYQFRGHVVVQAVLRDLVGRRGLGSNSNRDVLVFGGGSAGARGAMVHLDYVGEMLGDAASQVDVVGFLDSNYWVDVELYNGSSFVGFPHITKSVYSFANIQHLGLTCIGAYPEEQWRCIFGEYRMPHVRTPYFMVASQYDTYQLNNLLKHSPPYPEEALPYAESLAARTVSSLGELQARSNNNAIFSWACSNHAVSMSHSGFDQLTCSDPENYPAAATMDQAFAQFLNSVSDNPPLQWIDWCRGVNCGSGCS